MHIHDIPITQLEAHPLNSNVMPVDLFNKLRTHIKRTGRYPPVIVRMLRPQIGDDLPRYQLLDGHHRVLALRKLGKTHARCVVWQVDDDEAALLLATLNRLQGRDDPLRRAKLIHELAQRFGDGRWQRLLPERQAQLDHLRALHQPAPPPAGPQPLTQMPVAVHFFLLPAERDELEACLRQIAKDREQALMQLVRQSIRSAPPPVASQQRGNVPRSAT